MWKEISKIKSFANDCSSICSKCNWLNFDIYSKVKCHTSAVITEWQWIHTLRSNRMRSHRQPLGPVFRTTRCNAATASTSTKLCSMIVAAERGLLTVLENYKWEFTYVSLTCIVSLIRKLNLIGVVSKYKFK